MNPIKQLSVFGQVKTCKVVKEQVVTIVVTHGFTSNAIRTLDFIKKCNELFPNYPLLQTCITENNLAIIVLSK